MTTPRQWFEVAHAPAPGSVLGKLKALQDGHATVKVLNASGAPDKSFRYLLLRTGDQVTAFVNRCAHFGVPLAERQEHLHFQPHISITCNVHYAKYRWSDGACLSGECDGDPLLAIPVTVDADGDILVGPVCESDP